VFSVKYYLWSSFGRWRSLRVWWYIRKGDTDLLIIVPSEFDCDEIKDPVWWDELWALVQFTVMGGKRTIRVFDLLKWIHRFNTERERETSPCHTIHWCSVLTKSCKPTNETNGIAMTHREEGLSGERSTSKVKILYLSAEVTRTSMSSRMRRVMTRISFSFR